MTFVQRAIDLQFRLSNDPQSGAVRNFPESGKNTLTVSGLRVHCRISKIGAPAIAYLHMKVFGLTGSVIKQLSTFGIAYQLVGKSTVTVTAGDVGSPLSTVFVGTVTQAWADFSNQPDTPLEIEAQALAAEGAIAAVPNSYTGSTDVSGVMQTIASQMGLTFENNGVTAKLANPYFYGSLRQQAQDCADAAGCQWTADDGVLAIWPKGKFRNTTTIPTISSETGMIGSPTFTADSVIVKAVFNKDIKFGGQINIKTAIPALQPANGKFTVLKIEHQLDAQVLHGGQWMSTIQGFNPNFRAPIIKS